MIALTNIAALLLGLAATTYPLLTIPFLIVLFYSFYLMGRDL